LIKYTLEQIEDIKTGEVLEEDLNKIKESYLVNYKENLKKDNYWLNYMANSVKFDRDWSRVHDYEKKVKSLTVQDLVDVAKTYLDDAYFLAVLNPED